MHGPRAFRAVTAYDAALAGGLAVLAAVETFGAGGSEVVLRTALAAGTAAGLLVRRTNPLGSATWISAGLAAETLLTESPDQIGVLLAVVIGAFSVTARSNAREGLAGIGLLGLAISLSIALDPSDSISNIPPTLVLFLLLPAGFGMAVNRRSRRVAELEVMATELARRAQAAGELERRRIARELHDVVSHAVTLIAVQAEAGRSVLDGDHQRADAAFEAIGLASRDALAELSSLLRLLKSDVPVSADRPRMAELAALLDGARTAGARVSLAGPLPEVVFESKIDHCLVRVVQEGLTNALRHTSDPDVTLGLDLECSSVVVRVISQGTPHRSAYGGSGRGIDGLRERVEELGGTLTAHGSEQGHFELTATIPR
ncbi:MAG: histidine kinase [Actinomycetes bacterium]